MLPVKFIYLASPYSHPEEMMREYRSNLITRIAAQLTVTYGHAFFLPITQSHAMTKAWPGLKGTSFESWEAIDLTVLSKCDELWVVCMDGWQQSVGVTAEIKFAVENNIPVKYIYPSL